MPNNRCTNCVTYNLECSYVEAAKVRPKVRLAVDIPLISDSETRTPERVCRVGTLQRLHRLNARIAMWRVWRLEWSRWRSFCSR